MTRYLLIVDFQPGVAETPMEERIDGLLRDHYR